MSTHRYKKKLRKPLYCPKIAEKKNKRALVYLRMREAKWK
jgi:hypothetical protein